MVARMIMVVGSGRSGTTFLAKLLDSHPDILYRHEPDSSVRESGLPFLIDEANYSKLEHVAREYLQRLATTRSARTSGHLPHFPKRYRSGWRQRVHESVAVAAKVLGRLRMPYAERLLRVPDLISGDAQERYRMLIKSVMSLGRVALFLRSVPTLRVIHVVRHPAGVIASYLRGFHSGRLSFDLYVNSLFDTGYAFGFGIGKEDVLKMSIHEQLAFQWMVLNERLYLALSADPRYMLLKYEDLCIDTIGVASECFTFLGMELDDQTMTFLRGLESYGDTDAGFFSVMKSPKSTVDRWRKEVTAGEVARILATVRGSEVGRFYQ